MRDWSPAQDTIPENVCESDSNVMQTYCACAKEDRDAGIWRWHSSVADHVTSVSSPSQRESLLHYCGEFWEMSCLAILSMWEHRRCLLSFSNIRNCDKIVSAMLTWQCSRFVDIKNARKIRYNGRDRNCPVPLYSVVDWNIVMRCMTVLKLCIQLDNGWCIHPS